MAVGREIHETQPDNASGSSAPAAPGPGRVILAMNAITKTFPGVRALSGVDMTVRAGEVAAILGENGAGKSTLMNILAGVFSDYGGVIELDGVPVAIHSPKAAQHLGIAMIHQELNLVPDMSIVDNIFLGREPRTARGTIDRRRMDEQATRLLAEVGLTLHPRRPVRQCRVAEQQLIEVAKALSASLRVLVMDEPTSALADAEVRRLFTVIRRLAAQGVGIVYISHRLEELDEIADSVTVLRDGAYIGRREMAGTTRGELISMMVGRPLDELFPRSDSPTGPGEEVIRVEGLDLAGDRREGRAALHGVRLIARAGEIVGLAGLMGAGRSETLEAIYGVFPRRAVHGNVRLRGRRYQPRSPRHAIRNGIALVAEDRKAQSLVLTNSVRFNASLAALGRFMRRGTVSAARERAAVAGMVTDLRIKTPGLNTAVANLSGGNQQKVVLAKCLLTEPSLILMDEPTRGIDVGAKAEIYQLMTELARRGSAIVMVSSELPELLAMCDRIVVLCEGRVTAEFRRGEGSQEAILDAAMDRQAVLGIDAASPSRAPARREVSDE
ncbi:ribose import ATP-binding protein RbsA [Rugosimonospora africana]|uniref:Ribose import ATP-binding protein RbsA n=1 Tax=Rugosimonospora africana TaxID=556532 RepID=A0A8J3VS67_9ACTN|nr:ribose import ATP-binding protein RbsA [Rugosimonospora africana]